MESVFKNDSQTGNCSKLARCRPARPQQISNLINTSCPPIVQESVTKTMPVSAEIQTI